MKGNRWFQIGLIGVVLLLFAAVFAVFAFNRPLGPSLDLDKPGTAIAKKQPTVTTQPDRVMDISPEPPSADTTSLSSPTATPGELTPVCDQAGRVNLLLLGQNPMERFPRGADAIRLVVVDYDHPSVQMLAMPPDLWVDTDRLEGVAAATLTEAFGLAETASPSGDAGSAVHAARIVAQALSDNFGYRADKYLILDQSAFKQVIDTIGSIEVYVPEAVDGAPDGYGFYESGMQEMDGQRALDYVRMLQPVGHSSNEWARFERQNQVIKGIQHEILKPEHWNRIPNFVNDFYDLLVTNLSFRELLSLECMMDATGGNMHLLEVTPDMVTPGADGVLIPNRDAIRALIAKLTEAN